MKAENISDFDPFWFLSFNNLDIHSELNHIFLTTLIHPIHPSSLHPYPLKVIKRSSSVVVCRKGSLSVLLSSYESNAVNQRWWKHIIPNSAYPSWVAAGPVARVVSFGLRKTRSHVALFHEGSI